MKSKNQLLPIYNKQQNSFLKRSITCIWMNPSNNSSNRIGKIWASKLKYIIISETAVPRFICFQIIEIQHQHLFCITPFIHRLEWRIWIDFSLTTYSFRVFFIFDIFDRICLLQWNSELKIPDCEFQKNKSSPFYVILGRHNKKETIR